MIQIKLSMAGDGTLRLRQVKFSWPAQRLIETIPNKSWTGEEWSMPAEALADVYAKFAGAGQLDIDADVKARLSQLRKTQADELAPPITDYQFKTQPYAPYDHQRLAFAKGIRKPYFAYFMEMGTGKSRSIVDILSYLVQKERIEGGLLLVPKAVLFNWANEISMFSPLPEAKRKVMVITGQDKLTALKQAANSYNFFITNYATVLQPKLFDVLKEIMVRRKLSTVLDEAQAIKNSQSKTYKAVEELGLLSVCRYILTGTPAPQSPLDYYALFKFLHPDILGHRTFTSFKAEYARMMKKPGIPVPLVVGFNNLSRLRMLTEPHMYRVLKKDCLDLPDKVYRRVEVGMGVKQAAIYKQMSDEAVVMVEGAAVAAPVVLTKMMRLQQIASGFLPRQDEFGTELPPLEIADATKIDAAVELVQEARDSEASVIVWCRFIWEVVTLKERLEKEGHAVVTYYGAKTAQERQTAVEHIQNKRAHVFIGQIQTGGTGITLTACSVVIYVSNTFSLSDRLQSEDRPHRIGQTQKVTYIDLVASSIDKLVLRAHRDKKDLADIVTGDSLRRLLSEAS